MKEKEIRERATCGNCGKKFGAAKALWFYVVKIKQYAINVPALKRQSGLEQFFDGNVQIARAMSPDEDLAKMMHKRELTICDTCANTDVRISFLAFGDES
jgi:hypothetical protein